MQFSDFDFSESLMDGLYAMGFDVPTPIQEAAIPLILNNRDMIACAQTGTGKTAAFVLPILNKLANSKTDNRLNTLILAPTRELALQIDQQIEGFSYYLGISSIPVYGGGDGETFLNQKRAMEMGAEIVIATPGRLIALLNSGKIKFDNLKHLVLDEADRMLDMGFMDDIMRIISHLPKVRQTILFSATMPANIRKLAGKILSNPENINIATSQPAVGIDQKAYHVNDDQKYKVLVEWLSNTKFESIIVFASRKDTTKQLEHQLRREKLDVKSFHSDLEQPERVNLINAFKHRKIRIIVGTDILSRGIDIDGIDLVINYDVPGNPEDYIHRIGRTARGDSFGTAVTLINDADRYKFKRIEDMVKKPIEIENLTGKDLTQTPIKKPFVKKFKSSANRNKA